ncbi:hypothetical protein QCE47_16340 [Caballeronia sp. LZ025]|uniref:hypothetical protein n=1 Tax=Caballeronia TaxID=1827195 RepID=UPI001FD34ADE|nr:MULTISPECIES: hypothetical protein [Caballeronia]MDR5733899.1 hypothetical protein [Caballeronia sp. LZ025]
MVLSDDFAQRITHGVEEVLIRPEDIAFEIELNDRIGAIDCSQSAVAFRDTTLEFGDVRCELDDLDEAAVRAIDRVVGSLNPHVTVILRTRLYWPASYSPRPSLSQKER